ncbi:MAG: L-lysine 6-transaminase [Polyangiaceae bacterium]
MFQRSKIAPGDVHETLRKHMLVDGFSLVVDLEHSHGSWAKDAKTGQEYLDFFSFFASNPVGFNHPALRDEETQERLARAATYKVANSDKYTTFMAEFVDTLARSAGRPELPHYFFVDGGALAVENALKVAFDWKVRKNLAAGRGEIGKKVLHFERAFHGRSGYTLSITNTDPNKTQYFPMFDWPRIPAPEKHFPFDDAARADVEAREKKTIAAAEAAFAASPHEIAAIIIEPVQGEGGDNHFRPELFQALRKLADEHEAMLILDEVQTGLGLTGKYWAYEHFGVTPDIISFAKKLQIGGIFVGKRVDEVEDNVFKKPGRINSTWGGSLVDMVRCTRILEVVENEKLVDNSRDRGKELLAGLEGIQERHKGVTNARGLGLMCALDMPDTETRNAAVKACFADGTIVLPCGTRSVRFRPALTVTAEEVAEGVKRLEKGIAAVLK